jgi:hypothetical protein
MLARLPMLILAAAVSAESGDPEPAPASRKGRKKKEEVAAAQAAEEAAREAAEAAAQEAEAAAIAQWLDSGGNPEEDRRRFPYHRWVWAVHVLLEAAARLRQHHACSRSSAPLSSVAGCVGEQKLALLAINA